MYKNPHFVDKTVLTVGDGLYGSIGDQSTKPEAWTTFGNQAPSSLFFSRDPVAMDCVMYDFLEAEVGVPSGADDYLAVAAQEGLGIFEHRAPEATEPKEWYSLIDYAYLDLDQSVRLDARCEDRTAYLSWTLPVHAGLAGYRICYTSETGEPVNEGPSPIDVPDPSQLTLELTGLTMYSIYEFWIEPYDGKGSLLIQSNHVYVMPTDILLYLPFILS
jgi:hypothetical protein